MSVVGAYGPWLERCLAGWPRELSFLHPRWEAVAAWRDQARSLTLGLLCVPPEHGAPAPPVEVRESYVLEDLRIDELRWSLPYGPPTEALFIRPAAARRDLPGVLGLHDHGGVKYFGKRKICRTREPSPAFIVGHQGQYYGAVAWANELARRGFAVLVHDLFGFESRRVLASQLPGFVVRRIMGAAEEQREMTPEDLQASAPVFDYDGDSPERTRAYNAFGGAHEHIVAKALFSAGLSWPGVSLVEDRAALGVLCGLPGVDPTRIGCCGLSGGGLRSCFLAGLDSRVRCSVTAGFMTTWKDLALTTCYTHTWMIYVPQLPRHMDFPDILGMHAPLPALVLATDRDPLFSLEETHRAADTLQRVYAKAGAADAFRFSLYPGPHKLDRPMQEEAFTWLARWLEA